MSNFKFVFFLLCSSQFKTVVLWQTKNTKGKRGETEKDSHFLLAPHHSFPLTHQLTSSDTGSSTSV